MEKTVLYFTATRWVLLGKVIDPVLSTYSDKIFDTAILTICVEKWDVLNEYFIVYLPEHDKATTLENKKHDTIKSNLSSNISKVRLSPTYVEQFLTNF